MEGPRCTNSLPIVQRIEHRASTSRMWVQFLQAGPYNGDVSVVVSTTVCEAVSMSSNLIHHTKLFAPVRELVYLPSLEVGICGFESHLGHHYGSVVEWSMALVLKTRGSQGSVGSNPTASSKNNSTVPEWSKGTACKAGQP